MRNSSKFLITLVLSQKPMNVRTITSLIGNGAR
jgi:hypothetical protein